MGMYYNPETQEKISRHELCVLLNSSIPEGAEEAGNWHHLHTGEMPHADESQMVAEGPVELTNGIYIQTWALQDKPKEQMEAESMTQAKAEADNAIVRHMRQTTLQTSSFSRFELSAMAKAHIFEVWQAGQTYTAGYRLEHEGVVYEVVQAVVAQDHQPPSAEGMLAIYRPLASAGSYGMDGSKETPFEFIYGMDVHSGEYYTYDGKLWLAVGDMLPCIWYPGQEGVHQWQGVTE